MDEKEKFYDEQIAGPLAELGKKCQDAGISMVASCEWKPGEYARTRTLQPDAGFAMLMADLALRSNGNVDSFFIALAKHAKSHGHNSLVLSLLDRVQESEKSPHVAKP